MRSWAKDRLGEQEDQLRAVERAVGRLAELDADRHETLQVLSASLTRLAELGLDQTQVAEILGADLTCLVTGHSHAARSTRRTTATPAAASPAGSSVAS